jgi:hypothetical protein
MTDDATPREVGSHAGLGLAPERAAFEAWCCKRWAGDRNALTIRDDGEYLNGHVQFAWAAWQASRTAELERICSAIKAEDDHCCDEGDYMLDSEDCISVARGTWARPNYSLKA